jgi:S-adenosylmethionine-diacylglycerol 3-amino-3-carboxypropyl transferase
LSAGIRYASVWEDADVLCRALAPRAKGGKVLSIASAGDNALALLSLGARRVVAVDLNPDQLACVEIRRAAFAGLPDPQVAPFLGVGPDPGRRRAYDGLRHRLEPAARRFWDAHPDWVEAGVMHAGRFERYLFLFGRRFLPLLQPGPWRRALLGSDEPAVQDRIYRQGWDHPLWRGFFKLFFSRALMGAFGRERAFYAQVQGSVADRILERTRRAFCTVPAASNPYLQAIVHGGFQAQALPYYLRPAVRPLIRARLERLHCHLGPVQDAPGGPFHAFNLSDLFEYLDPTAFASVYGALVGRAAPGARLAWWNLLLERRSPLAGRGVRRLTAQAARLHKQERAWFYGSLELDEVLA